MKWVAGAPPIYVWDGDSWFNESQGKTYHTLIPGYHWRCKDGDFIYFPPRTKIFREGIWWELDKDRRLKPLKR